MGDGGWSVRRGPLAGLLAIGAADNPSLSLKYRLRRAAALDQFERANRAQPAGESAAVRAAAARAEIAPAGGDFMLSNGGTKATVRRAHSE